MGRVTPNRAKQPAGGGRAGEREPLGFRLGAVQAATGRSTGEFIRSPCSFSRLPSRGACERGDDPAVVRLARLGENRPGTGESRFSGRRWRRISTNGGPSGTLKTGCHSGAQKWFHRGLTSRHDHRREFLRGPPRADDSEAMV